VGGIEGVPFAERFLDSCTSRVSQAMGTVNEVDGPRSPTGMISGRFIEKMRNIWGRRGSQYRDLQTRGEELTWTVQSPIPRTSNNAFLTSSSSISHNLLACNLPSKNLSANPRIYSTFLPESPALRSVVVGSSRARTCEGVGKTDSTLTVETVPGGANFSGTIPTSLSILTLRDDI
jgi:hypothetical protein